MQAWPSVHLSAYISVQCCMGISVSVRPVNQQRRQLPKDYLSKTTTRLRGPRLRLLNQFPIETLLYKTTTCLTPPMTTFLFHKWKKKLSKTTTTKLYPANKWETNIRQQCVKNKRLVLYLLYCYFIKPFKIFDNKQSNRVDFGTQSNIYGGAFFGFFCDKVLTIFAKKLHRGLLVVF